MPVFLGQMYLEHLFKIIDTRILPDPNLPLEICMGVGEGGGREGGKEGGERREREHEVGCIEKWRGYGRR